MTRRKIAISTVVTIIVLWVIGAIGEIAFDCQGGLGSGVHCAKGGILGSFMESYAEMLEVGVVYFALIVFPLLLILGIGTLIWDFIKRVRNRSNKIL
jgi:hypothetical protein